MWTHTECSFISDAEYGTLENSICSWICPKYKVLHFSDSFFSELIEVENQNRFEPLSREKGKPSVVKWLKVGNININSIRGKILEPLAFLDAHQPQVAAI